MSMSATVTELPTGMLARSERLLLGARLTLAMLAAGLLVVALAWEFAVPEGTAVATLVASTAAALVAVPVLMAAWQSLRAPSLHGIADRLIALALIAAWANGDMMTAAVLPIVMIIGHVLEERSLLGSREAIRALGRLTETQARRLRGGVVEIVPAASLRPGDLVELRAGDRVPADGIVRAGTASLDMASLTGESVPVDVTVGETALLGAIATNGRLEVEVTLTGADTTLGRIIALMRAAEDAKPPVTRLLERYAGQYLSLVLVIAGGTWFASGNMAATLAVLVAACPCALVLAAPATAIAAIAVAARHGILIKGAAFLESLADVRSVVFDKTGTLTTGELSLARAMPCAGTTERDLLLVAASLGVASSHPVSRAAVRAAMRAAPDAASPAVTGLREEGGFGMTGSCAGVPVAFGRPELFGRLGVAVPPVPAHDGPIAGVGRDGVFLGWLLFADAPRPEAASVLAELRGLGLERQLLLTGDRAAVARRIGGELGIPEICAETLPEQKMQRVQQETRNGFPPLVVGDGINDSLALRAGAVGVAMGAQGTDVALASADVVLITSDLRRIATAIRLSRRCRRTIQVNVAIGLGWTMVLVALAAAGLLGAQGAVIAALLHNLSTFIGLANAGRLLLFDETGRAVPPTP
ncbi:Heavy metal translocating P-type ATPase [Rhodovastum atsumiense]|uniref:P-type Zn(2+) transporter n=1 Tax=Rhodovastum atsumiense TaxID=504468 RepID=A0A5M6IUX1_9PROT|nr:heavy metal translocating P-type ATPase [Rhodovastum atsumiense]KAA5611749.1 heavy metal translocating P-type ATPase [Rhodovastum atsumiense]CAH2604332.1 Heavy metal translocating P-type ATPase [Rhodovastum atsumiense]